jgi:hypothetical protein
MGDINPFIYQNLHITNESDDSFFTTQMVYNGVFVICKRQLFKSISAKIVFLQENDSFQIF